MRRRMIIAATSVSLLAASLGAAPAAAQYNPRGAEQICRDQVRNRYGTNGIDGVTSSDRGGGRFVVNGNANRGNDTAYFTCRVQNGYVSNINMGDWTRRKGNDSGGAIAAVGAAVLLGAIIAAASSKKKSHEYDTYDNPGYNDGNYGRNSYSPANGVTCYRDQRACFDDRQNYIANWTAHEFGN